MTLSEETFFITGFPGFIAGRLIERLAAEDAHFILLDQPALHQQARAEIVELALSDRARIAAGDITRENLGMSSQDLEVARRETTTVFHLAAIYDLAVERDLALRVNVEGTRNVNNFAKSVVNLRRHHHVSTCYVAGKRKGLIREDELGHNAGFRNHYEATK